MRKPPQVPTAQDDWAGRVRERLAAEGVTPSAHREAIDEIAEHLNDLHRVALSSGKTASEADAEVEAELSRMGPLAIAVADRARRQRAAGESGDWKSGLTADLRHAVRVVSRERSFSAIVILTLAIGIGACTAVFSIINALLLGSLPYPHPEQLTLLWESDRDNREQTFIVAYPNYEDWKRETRSFQSMGIWEYRTFNVASDQEPEQVPGIRASSSLFTTLAVSPAMGRVFSEQEEAPGHRVAVISDSVWRTHLGGSAAAIGKQLRLNGEPFEVIGVMPPGFEFPQARTGVWVPFGTTDQDRERGSHSFWVAARLQAGRGLRRGARGRRTGWPLASAEVRRQPRRGRDADAHVRPRRPDSAHHADGTDGRGRDGAADRLRQHRESSARPGPRAPA